MDAEATKIKEEIAEEEEAGVEIVADPEAMADHLVKQEKQEGEEGPSEDADVSPVAESVIPSEERVLRPLPPPASAEAWRAVYEAKRQQALAAAAAKESNSLPEFPALSTKESAEKLSNGPMIAEKVDPKVNDVMMVPDVMMVSATPRPNNVDLPAQQQQLQVMSNNKRKKLQEAELKKTSVVKLIKKVKVDMNRPPDDWASEYEARKSAALSSIVSGAAEPNVGSMSAFHTGLYGKELLQEEQSKCEPSQVVPRNPNPAQSCSSFVAISPSPPAARPSCPRSFIPPANQTVLNRDLLARTTQTFAAFQSNSCYNTEDQSNEFKVVGSALKRKPPPSPLDLIQMEKQNPNVHVDLVKHNIDTAQDIDLEEEEEDERDLSGDLSEIANASSSGEPQKKKKVTMASLFKQVKCDAKRSSEDWQVAYEARKRARIEEDSRSRANQVLTRNLRSASSSLPSTVSSSSAGQGRDKEEFGPRSHQQQSAVIACDTNSSLARQQFGARNPNRVSQSFVPRNQGNQNLGSQSYTSRNFHPPHNQLAASNQRPAQLFATRNSSPMHFAARNQSHVQRSPGAGFPNGGHPRFDAASNSRGPNLVKNPFASQSPKASTFGNGNARPQNPAPSATRYPNPLFSSAHPRGPPRPPSMPNYQDKQHQASPQSFGFNRGGGQRSPGFGQFQNRQGFGTRGNSNHLGSGGGNFNRPPPPMQFSGTYRGQASPSRFQGSGGKRGF